MKVSEVTNILLDGIAPIFKKYGFHLSKKNREFKRNINYSTQIFDLYFYKKGDFIKIKPEIRIKISPIEKIYREITTVQDRPFKTLGNHLFEIVRYFDYNEEIHKGEGSVNDWLIENNNDIYKLIEVIPKYLEETILPYFKENSTVQKVDNLLNKYPNELSIHNSLYPLRANLAIIAAKLNKNPKYSDLLKIYEKELKEADETYKIEFAKLKEMLNNL